MPIRLAIWSIQLSSITLVFPFFFSSLRYTCRFHSLGSMLSLQERKMLFLNLKPNATKVFNNSNHLSQFSKWETSEKQKTFPVIWTNILNRNFKSNKKEKKISKHNVRKFKFLNLRYFQLLQQKQKTIKEVSSYSSSCSFYNPLFLIAHKYFIFMRHEGSIKMLPIFKIMLGKKKD